MPAHPVTPAPVPLIVVMSTIFIVGLILAWIWQISPSARRTPHLSRVRHIAAPWYYFVAMCAFVLLAAFFSQVLFVQLCAWFWPALSTSTAFGQVVAQGVFNLGAIAGVLYARRFLFALENLPRIALIAHAQPKPAPAISFGKAILVGVGVFCIIRTAIIPVALAWDWILNRAGVSAADQDLLELFRNETSPVRLGLISFVAIILAPVFEEMVFRGGLFGYLRTRMHRQFALIVPSLLFALVHFNLKTFPLLFVISIIFSIAYERTGRLTVNIIAHALLNLSTIATILLGYAN